MLKALTIIWLLFLIAGCRSLAKNPTTKVKGILQLDTTSMSIHELNNWIADSHIALVTDIGANRSVVLHNGVLKDAFNILSGEKGVGIVPNAHGSSTTLGKFAISIVEYCPTYWRLGEVIKPCKSNNPLGRYGLWFSTHIDSSIHSSFTDHHKDYSLPADKRRLTKGSIQAKEQDLENFIHLIFASAPFANHPLPKKMKQLKAENDRTNVSTLINSPQNISGRKSSETIRLISQLGDAVDLDVKMLVVDSRSWTESSDKMLARQPLMRILTEEDSSADLRLVRDCVALKYMNLTSGPNSSTPLASLIPGDIILSAYYHQATHHPSLGSYVITDQNIPAWLPHNPHKPSMACSSQYYWSSKSHGQLLRINGNKQSCSTNELVSLTEPKVPDQKVLPNAPKAGDLAGNLAKITTTPLYEHMKCLAQGNDETHCEAKSGCTNPFLFDHHNPEVCLGFFEFLFQHIGPTTEYEAHVKSYCTPG